MFENLRRDATKYASLGGWYRHPSFWIVAVYRYGVWASSFRSAFLRNPLWIFYLLARIPFRVVFNVGIWAGPHGARIGPGFCLIHPFNVLITSGAEIGQDCLVFHEVTIGQGSTPGLPKIGDGVVIYVGARILGGIAIGDYSHIGANCVVMQDLPRNSVVLSAPIRVIPKAFSPSATATDASIKLSAKK